MGAEPIQDLSIRLARVAAELSRLSIAVADDRGDVARPYSLRPSAEPARRAEGTSLNLARAQHRYDERRKRAAIFGSSDLFGEPAWDILLDLYIAQAKGRDVSVSSACIGSAVPPTTGLRWLGMLEQAGLVVRNEDARDHRRVLVRLSADGVARMNRFLAMEERRSEPSPESVGATALQDNSFYSEASPWGNEAVSDDRSE